MGFEIVCVVQMYLTLGSCLEGGAFGVFSRWMQWLVLFSGAVYWRTLSVTNNP
jgi:hypothetical protein